MNVLFCQKYYDPCLNRKSLFAFDENLQTEDLVDQAVHGTFRGRELEF